jgi:Cu+-exporting ATPase
MLSADRMNGGRDCNIYNEPTSQGETAMAATKEKDPVCGMSVKNDAKMPKTELHGREYHFCSDECKREFEQHPERYAQKGEHTAGPKSQGKQ